MVILLFIGWLMRELQLDFTTMHFKCGAGPLRWQGWDVDKAEQLEGGDKIDVIKEGE